MKEDIVGWDIGGAHLKIAHLTSHGLIKSADQYVCPLWRGLDRLEEAIEAASHVLEVESLSHCQHAVTMTAELVDLFESRDEGVEVILSLMKQLIAPNQLWVFCGRDGLLSINQLRQEHYRLLASANWLATAMLVADSLRSGLLIDIGSTTTDIVAIENHRVISASVSDYDRLLSDELVYTGVIRTAVMAVSHYGYFQGNRVPMMAEYFATMADVYRLTQELPGYADQSETADGKPKTTHDSARRLARMIGLDLQFSMMNDWVMLAKSLRAEQLETIKRAVIRVLSTMRDVEVSMVGAGVGRFLVRDLALQCGLEYCDIEELMASRAYTEQLPNIADYAPAVAVACLLHHQLSQ